ncbi:D-2-hydroxyacid dehydrogenase [Agriterribacter sp.]|uniref:D-2-hydroxyacid dehydrogenase n=1 Tax=Agriterribacter sp. TaxID=2821509 RepID=UPI002C4D69FA|nr:D-2-hydroxyacid dehydrogenase [Agriterribacter sp.]HTN06175.1 D-2-hydroxyacid dehydrogenase [Agriterribacter sp.]
MINVLIDMPVHDSLLNSLNSLPGIRTQIIKTPAEELRSLPVEQIMNCEVLFCTTPPVNHACMLKLKMIQISSAGYTQLVGQNFEERGIRACNALGVFDVPIAEWNIAMMINLMRNMRSLMHNQDSQIWDRSPCFQRELRGAVVGIWGYGGIGRETARLAKSLGMKVHVLCRSEIKQRTNFYSVEGTGDIEGKLPDRIFLMDKKKEFLEGLDFLIMAIPHTNSTEGIVGEAELRMLPPQAFLLNPARGLLIQEQPLLNALQKGWIAGAALDTHYHYPMPANHPLWAMPNVIMTPHISGSSAGTRFLDRVWDIFIQNVKKLQNSETLLNELTFAQLSGRA